MAYAAWYGGLRWALPLSVLPIAHVGTVMAWEAPWVWVTRVAAAHRALSHEVGLLEGLLPICSYCKRIRDQSGDWQALEKYIQDRSDATFTHGVCESCLSEELTGWKRSG